jgi:hypothetical protein
MTAAITHIGELVSDDINRRFRSDSAPSTCAIKPGCARREQVKQLNRCDIERVTLIFPGGSEMRVPVETRVIVEY